MDLALRAIVGFVFVLLLTRAVGHRELSSPEPFDLILRNLSRNRITLEELVAAARTEGIAAIQDVRWAVPETSGAISFIRK